MVRYLEAPDLTFPRAERITLRDRRLALGLTIEYGEQTRLGFESGRFGQSLSISAHIFRMMSSPSGADALTHLNKDAPEGAWGLLRGAVESMIGANFMEGNSVEVLRNGVEIFPAMKDAIKAANRSIEMVTFVYWTGQIARDVANLLAERSQSGIRVRVVLDAFGSSAIDDELIETMSAAGVAIERFRPVVRWKFWEADHRTHRKILIVDDTTAFTGGVGIAEEWEGDASNPSEWRDTHFRIEGPAVLGLKATFLADWRDTGHPIDPTDAEAKHVPESGEVLMTVVDASAQIGLNPAERVLEALVDAAQQRIIIQTPYFNPTEALKDKLINAARRRIEVDILIPGPHIDKRVSSVVAEDEYEPLVESGIRVWIYQPTMMHTKAVLVDGVLSLVGSVNINQRSIHKDEEAAVVILDRDVTGTLEGHFRDDVARSELARPAVGGRPMRRRLAAKVLRPINKEF